VVLPASEPVLLKQSSAGMDCMQTEGRYNQDLRRLVIA
jgi:hypothetical protein